MKLLLIVTGALIGIGLFAIWFKNQARRDYNPAQCPWGLGESCVERCTTGRDPACLR